MPPAVLLKSAAKGGRGSRPAGRWLAGKRGLRSELPRSEGPVPGWAQAVAARGSRRSWEQAGAFRWEARGAARMKAAAP